MPYVPTCFKFSRALQACVPLCLCLLRSFPFLCALHAIVFHVPYLPTFFLRALRVLIFLRALRSFSFYMLYYVPSFFSISFTCFCFSYMPSYFLWAVIFLHDFSFQVTFMFSSLTVFIFYVSSLNYVLSLLLYAAIFLTFIFVNCFKFFAHLTGLHFLHSLRCFIFFLSSGKWRWKRGIDWFFLFFPTLLGSL